MSLLQWFCDIGDFWQASEPIWHQALIEWAPSSPWCLPHPLLPGKKASSLAVAGLLVGSVVYHTAIMPRSAFKRCRRRWPAAVSC